MYHYLDENTTFVREMRRQCGEIMQELCHVLKQDYHMGAAFCLVGSGRDKLIVQNESGAVDLDYDLEIVRGADELDGRAMKERVRKAFNRVLHSRGWGDCSDSSAVLTAKKRRSGRERSTEFSMDVCIVATDPDGRRNRLIHQKTGCLAMDRYVWNPAPHKGKIREKAEKIKDAGQWEGVREQYLRLRNLYLRRNDQNHPGFVCYEEAVNNVYNRCCQTWMPARRSMMISLREDPLRGGKPASRRDPASTGADIVVPWK